MNLGKLIKSKRLTLVLIILFAVCMFLSSYGKKTQNEKVYRVGILVGLKYMPQAIDYFKDKMVDLGYVEGKNIIYDLQLTHFEPIKEKQILKQFVKDKVDLIFALPTEVALAAKEITAGTGIPVVFAVANIEGTGLVDSVRRPGGNITGVRYPGPDLAVKRFEVMRELAPQAKTIWIPYQRGCPIIESQMEVLHPAAAATGIKLMEFPADDAAEVQAELDARNKLDDVGFDAILFIPETLTCKDDAFEVMGKFAYEHKMPIGGLLMQVGDYGSIFGVNINVVKTLQDVAILADKILKGTPAGTIPVVSSDSFLQINYTVAEQLRVAVPKGLLSRADEIIR